MQPVRRMRRTERREQILCAASRAFSRRGFVSTGLDDVATEAGISRVLLYRHFDSKADLYRAVLDHACARLTEAVDADQLDADGLPALFRAASADPDGFRLLFRHAAREPEFRAFTDTLTATSTEVAYRSLAQYVPAGPWLDWSAQVVPAFAIEAVIAWLDAGRPDPDAAAARVDRAIRGIIESARDDATS